MTSSQQISTVSTPFGLLEIGHDDVDIFNAKFVTTQHSKPMTEGALGEKIKQELSAYLTHSHHQFQLPLKPQGSLFQLKVWEALLTIQPGHTLSYGELAWRLNSAPRAIGQACKRNPIALFIPCHRVVGKNNLGGYMGSPDALSFKRSLLAHEGYPSFFQ